MSYTPGPWNQHWIYGALRHISKNVDDDAFYFPQEGDEELNIPDVRACPGDAPLITAAPELLEALEECADRLQIHMKHTEDLVAHMKACKAIAKAKGLK